MNKRLINITTLALFLFLFLFLSPFLFESPLPSQNQSAMTSIGDAQVLMAAYDRWKATVPRHEGDRKLLLPLNYSKGLSSEFTKAQGTATLNLVDGSLAVNVSGLPEEDTYDVWLIDNRGGQSVVPEANDTMIHVGTLVHRKGNASLQDQLEQEALTGFELDLVVVTPTGKDPSAERILVGSPNLFQRLYYNEERGLLAKVADIDASVGPETSEHSLWSSPFSALVPAPAYAQKTKSLHSTLESLVARGEDLFFNETFNGNGRTCGTCHPRENNLTIDPTFIATLPPKDPLFVAEFIPELNFELNGGLRFEDPDLMRNFGLIVENQDGFDPNLEQFNMRGVPHTLALPTSLTINPESDEFPQQRTGWSGDGAPDSGSLRDFATGAVRQHFPLTTNRVAEGPGVKYPDFRFPEPKELDAMEAFQLSLGRQEELDLETLSLRGPLPSRGLEIFLTSDDEEGTVVAGKCNLCHGNAGANTLGSLTAGAPNNMNFDTGVERLPDQPARVFKAPDSFPCDGGFGTVATMKCGFVSNDSNNLGFGDNEFNTPTLVEAADTAPFFHNNSINTIEGAVAFYNSQAFNDTGLAGGISLEPTQVEAVAAFLRVINALENIRSSVTFDRRALSILNGRPARRVGTLLEQSRADVQDGIEVLQAVSLHLDAVEHLEQARRLLSQAISTHSRPKKIDRIRRAIERQQIARGLMLMEEENSI